MEKFDTTEEKEITTTNNTNCISCISATEQFTRNPGDMIKIYDSEGNYEGDAILIRTKPSWSDGLPYSVNLLEEELSEDNLKCDEVNVQDQTWVIKFLPGRFSSSWTTCRKITSFHSCGALEIE